MSGGRAGGRPGRGAARWTAPLALALAAKARDDSLFWPRRDGRLCGRIPIRVLARDARNASLIVGTGFRAWTTRDWTYGGPGRRITRPGLPGWGCKLLLHGGPGVLVSRRLETHRLEGGVLVKARWEGAGPGARAEVLSRFQRRELEVLADAGPRVAAAAAAIFRKGRTPYAARPTAWEASETRRRLAVWVAHHRAAGFERMYVVDNAPAEPSFRLAPAADVVYVSTETPFNLPHPTAGKDPFIPGQLAIETAVLAAARADWVLVSDADEFLYLRENSTARDLIRGLGPTAGALGFQPLLFWSRGPYDKKLVGSPCAAAPAAMAFRQAFFHKRKNLIRTSALVALSVHYVKLRPGFDDASYERSGVDTGRAFLAHFRAPYGSRNAGFVRPKGTNGYLDVDEAAVWATYARRTAALCARAPAEPPPPRPNHLVMSAATNAAYEAGMFRGFVDTMRHVAGYRGDCALFVLNNTGALADPEFRPWLERSRVDLVFVDEGPGWRRVGRRFADDAWGPNVPSEVERYRFYEHVLAARKPYDLVLWSDFRDTVWQRNPFDDFAADARGKDLVFFAEPAIKTLDETGYTRTWIEKCWGLEALDARVPRGSRTEVLCSGNAMGTGPAVLAYVRRFLATVDAQREARGDVCVQTPGIDQGHHNYLIRTLLPKDQFTITPWDAGPVANIASLRHRPAWAKRDREGYVLRRDGRRVALLHQYDRLDELKSFAYKLVARAAARAAAGAPEPNSTHT